MSRLLGSSHYEASPPGKNFLSGIALSLVDGATPTGVANSASAHDSFGSPTRMPKRGCNAAVTR
jgi:hypothetical protein